MSTNLFKMEFLRILRPTAFWCFFICFFIYIDMLFYKDMIDSGLYDDLIGVLDNPFFDGMIKGFGLTPDKLANPLGFYALRNTLVTMLIGSIYSVVTASSLIAQEEYDKTSEFLLSRPVSRLEIMNSKLLAFHVNLFLLNLIASIVGYVSLEIFKTTDYSLYSYFVLCVYSYLLTLIFSCIGLFVSLLVKRGRVFIGMIIGIVLGAYFLEIVSGVAESAEFLGWFSPFTYADKEVLAPGYGFELWNIIFFLAGSLLLTVASYRIFLRKDIVV